MRAVLLMIVTPPDSHIATYAVRKLARSLHESLHLCIYFNGLNPNLQRRIRQHVQGNPYVQLKDNYAQIAENREAIAAQVGKVMVTANGHACELREGLYEPQAEIWSRELVRFTEFDLAGIVDPDFEILEPDFIAGIQGAFADDERLGFFSTNYSPTVEFYDSYSREHCILEQRYHTWFCLYRRRALELESDFYFYEERGGKVRKWDHSARLQEKLHSVHGFSGRALAPEQWWKFLHYGAFAQNRSLTGTKLRLYRVLRIGRHNGFIHVHRSEPLSRLIRGLGERAYRWLRQGKYDRERESYIFESRPARKAQVRARPE